MSVVEAYEELQAKHGVEDSLLSEIRPEIRGRYKYNTEPNMKIRYDRVSDIADRAEVGKLRKELSEARVYFAELSLFVDPSPSLRRKMRKTKACYTNP